LKNTRRSALAIWILPESSNGLLTKANIHPCLLAKTGAGSLQSSIVIGSKSALSNIKEIPELLDIDKEIGRPYIKDPLMFNSQAWSRRLELPWVVEHIGLVDGLKILDVGSGVSALPIYLRRRNADVVSVDIDVPRGLPDGDVSRVKSAIPRLPFKDGSFDVVICVSVLEHVGADMAECFAEMCRLARKRVILTFDIVANPLSAYGLSSIELRAFARALNTRIKLPADPLLSPAAELGIWANQIGICMFCLDKQADGWHPLRLSRLQRFMIRLYRAAQARVFIHQTFRLRIRRVIRKA